MSLMPVMSTPREDGMSLKATHKSRMLQRGRGVGVSGDQWGQREIKA